MIRSRVVWLPAPYKAGFCITDDTDAASFGQVRAVYDFLLDHSFFTTKTVWPFSPKEPCGIPATPPSTLRGVTLEDPRYLDYCRRLGSQGFEISLHGASAGNNTRSMTQAALTLASQEFGGCDTFICHSKNADNLYWEEKSASHPLLRALLRLYASHHCGGEDPQSPYFWGDLCRQSVGQIRLFRTRRIDTLGHNPSMPYHDPRKPFVNGWFSATKRSLRDCARPEAIEALKQAGGLTVLYQYLHRYAAPETFILNQEFCEAVERLASDRELYIAPVSRMMRRLRLVQGLFGISHNGEFWLVNTNDASVQSLQLRHERNVSIESRGCAAKTAPTVTVVAELPPRSVTRFTSSEPLSLEGIKTIPYRNDGYYECRFPWGMIEINLTDTIWRRGNGRFIEPRSFCLDAAKSGRGENMLSFLSPQEELRLVAGQMFLIARELLLRKRSLRSGKYLDASRPITLEDHDAW